MSVDVYCRNIDCKYCKNGECEADVIHISYDFECETRDDDFDQDDEEEDDDET